MAELVVDLLETIQVEQQQGETTSAAHYHRDAVAQLFLKQPPVRQAGQRIDVGDPLELELALTQLLAALLELRGPFGHQDLQLTLAPPQIGGTRLYERGDQPECNQYRRHAE